MRCITRAIYLLRDRIASARSRVHYRALTSGSIDQHLPQLCLVDPSTIASVESLSSNPCFSLLCLCRNPYSLRTTHALLIVHGETNDILLQTKLVGLYGLFGLVRSARSVFDHIIHPDLFSFKVMMRWYFMNDLCWEIVGFYAYMRRCIRENDNFVFSIALKACSELRQIELGMKVHCHIIMAGNVDSFVLTGLVDMYAKCGDVESSRAVFDTIAERNVVCWTSMIVGYVQNDCAEDGLVLFNRMRGGLIEGNQHTLGSVVTACTKLGALHQGRWVHGYIIKKGTEFNSYLVSALVDFYAKRGNIRDARLIFDESCFIDLVSWTAMIVGYTQRGYPSDALRLFVDNKWESLSPNSVSTASVLSACAQSGNLKLGRSVHCLGVKLGLEDKSVTNALLDMYSKSHTIEDAHHLFDTALDKDLITWNSIISGYYQNDLPYEALRLFRQMRLESLVPDEVTLVTLLSACASLCALQVGSCLHASAIKGALLSSNIYAGTALLNLYAKCGDIEAARTVFDEMGQKNTITWSSMISSYGMQGDGSSSLALFSDMIAEKLHPCDATFMAILTACSHSGMVEEGWRCFASMCREHNLVPSMKHCGCMVDILARAGRLEEALDFIEKMPFKPDVSLFGTFLNGCIVYSRFDLGELAVKSMLDLHPEDASYYVLISKFYATCPEPRWSEAFQAINLMKRHGLSKYAAHSRVEVDTADDFAHLRVASFP